MRIAINGFGRIGRSLFRIIHKRSDLDIVAINDLFDHDALRYLLEYDTVMGRFEGDLELHDGQLFADGKPTRMLREANPARLPWEELQIDAVVESSGVFRTREAVSQHLTAGAERVVLTVPAKDEIDYTVVLGVNDEGLAADHRIISNASCTTNCLAPLVYVLHHAFGIKEGIINTIHAYTNDQRLADVPHADWRRSRAAAKNIIPTSTGAARAVGQVLPELNGKLDGIAARVPVPDGSVVDLFVELESSVNVEAIHEVIRQASQSPRFLGILQYADRPLVSSDIIGNEHSSIFDSGFTQVTQGRFAKVLSWYDNEWGYSNRVCDLLAKLSGLGRA